VWQTADGHQLFISAPGYHKSKRLVETGRRIVLHCVGDVRIKVHRRGDGGVTQALLGDLRMHAASQQLRRVAVSEVMKAHARQVPYAGKQVREFVSQAPRLLRLAVLAATHQGFAG